MRLKKESGIMHGEDCRDVMGILGQRPESRGPSDQMQPPTPSRVQLADRDKQRARVKKGVSFSMAILDRQRETVSPMRQPLQDCTGEGTKVRRWRR